MPELPEVETIVAYLRPRLRGATIRRVQIAREDVIHLGAADLRRELRGRRVDDVARSGKRIVIRLDPSAELIVHLGMSGRLLIEAAAAPVLPHTHVVLQFDDRAEELRFRDPRRFGGIWYAAGGPGAAAEGLRRLGPDALTIRVPQLRGILQRRRQIKALLLDQDLISGMGNIYCDETLFATRIHPLTPACDLDERQIRSLACSIRKTLRWAIDSGGSTLREYRQADGTEGGFQNHFRVYGRTGEPCPRCRTPIERLLVAARSSHFCPNCQILSD